jgi:hypothetical protein
MEVGSLNLAGVSNIVDQSVNDGLVSKGCWVVVEDVSVWYEI